MIPCPAASFPAEHGETVWSRRLEWAGRRGSPAKLTAKVAGRAHCCIACGHDIPRGALFGATLSGLIHYCSCCVTSERPEDQFKRGRAAA